jgi:hypothetical protein
MLSQDFTHFCNNGGRNVRYSDKVACIKYITLLEKLCTDNSIFSRVDKLYNVNPADWTPRHTATLNNDDAHITCLMIRAGKTCKKINVKATWPARNSSSPQAAYPTGAT